MTSLSVLVPAYNEQYLIATSLERLEVLETSPLLDRIQVVVVDDASADATSRVLRAFAEARGLRWGEAGTTEGGAVVHARGARGKTEWLFLRHLRNAGKGQAVKTALARAECEISVIHDADLEYHPIDLLRFIPLFEAERADAVFGSRFAGGAARRALLYRHQLGNKLLTFVTNWVTNVNLTDMETCYKAVRTDLLRSIPILSSDFRMEPELTIKLAKREARIFEVPISYSGRTYQEGKKIDWRDGFKALWAILRFWISARIHADDGHGSQVLGPLARARAFQSWIADVVRPLCGRRVLELGAGSGELTRRLVPRERYVVSDVDPLHVRSLQAMTLDRPYLAVTRTDTAGGALVPGVKERFDTVVCAHVLERVSDDVTALASLRSALAPGGVVVAVVPAGPRRFGTLDEVLGHERRYTRERLGEVAAQAGFTVERILPFNRLGALGWWLAGKLLRRRALGPLEVLAVDLLTPLLRGVEGVLPTPPLTWIAVLRPATDAQADRGAPAPEVSRPLAPAAAASVEAAPVGPGWAFWWLLPACCLLAVFLGVRQGQDASWDLRNYHYYNPFAWLTGRYGVDVAPAQQQSWYYPLADIPYFLLARAGVSSRIITGLLSLPAGIAFFLLLRLVRGACPAGRRWWALLAVLPMAAGTATGLVTIGTTMSEWHVVALLLGAIGLLTGWMGGASTSDRQRALWAGVLGGAAVGFKLTAGPFAIGLAVMALLLPGARAARVQRILLLGLAGAAGFVLVYGVWGWKMYQELGNPFFPMMNNLFHSPFAQPTPYRDTTFVFRSIHDVLLLPFRLRLKTLFLVSEMPLRDPRLMVAFPALLILSLWTSVSAVERSRWRALFAFFTVAYVGWAFAFGIYRYVLVLQVLASLAIGVASVALLPRGLRWAAIAVAAIMLRNTVYPGWERIPHGPPAVSAVVPAVPDDAMVVVAGMDPVGYVVPSLPPGVPVLSLENNSRQRMLSGGKPLPLQIQALERVKAHRGPLLLLVTRGATLPGARSALPLLPTLERLGLSANLDACKSITTPIDGDNLLLCPLAVVR